MPQPNYNDNGVLMLVGRGEFRARWCFDTYNVNGHRFTIDRTYSTIRLFPEQELPEGFMGWFGDSDAVCVGGPCDGQTVRLMQRGETPAVNEMLST